MLENRLKENLEAHKVPYTTINHSQAFTAMEIAEFAHVPGHELAKTVMVRMDGKLAMAVLPSTQRVNLEALRSNTGAAKVEIAHERDFCDNFPGCEVGAMPPFGNLYGMDVYVEPHLAADKEIAFNGGNHTELVKMAYDDFERLVKPRKVAM